MNYLTCPHCGETYRNITAVHVCSSGPYAVKLPADANINTKERIRQLARDAGFTSNDDQEVFLRVYEQELKKFAELIIQECLNIVGPDQHQRAYPDSYLGGYDGLELLENRVAKVRQHFGIS